MDWILLLITIFCLYVTHCFLKRRSKVSLENKVVVITGASSGLGKACSKEFHKLGCKVVLCSRNIEQLQSLKKELLAHSTSPEPEVIPLDLCDMQSIETAKERIDHMFPNGIDILINNAGISYRGEIIHTPIEVYRKVMEINFFGQVNFTKLLMPVLSRVKTGKTHIVSINSVQGNISIPHRSCYSTSKFACTAFYDCLRSEVSKLGINVCSVYPGYIKTNLSLNAVTAEGEAHGSLDATTASGMDPQYVAQKISGSIQQNKQELWISDSKSHLAMWLRVLSPLLYFWYMKKRAQSGNIKKS